MKFIISMKKTILTLIFMLFIALGSFANNIETTKYSNPIKIDNISEIFVNMPANIKFFKLNTTDEDEIINIRFNDYYFLDHIRYKIDNNRITFDTDKLVDTMYDYNTESHINICVYSKNNIQIKTNKKNLLIHEKKYDVLTNEN